MRHFLAFCGFLWVLFAQAQVGEPRHVWAFGVNGGWTASRITFTPSVRQLYHQSPTVGLTARFTSEKYFSLLASVHMELNYARLGWTEEVYSHAGKPLAEGYQRHLHYLQLPLLTSLALGQERRGVKGFLLLGPQLGYLLGDDEQHTGEWHYRTVGNQQVPDRPNDTYLQYGKAIEHRLDYGITAGLGLELGTRVGRFLLDARYYYGLADMFNNAKKDPFSRSAHATIMAKLTYLIDVTR